MGAMQRRKGAQSERDRFMALVSPEPNTGCWLWSGVKSTGPRAGYGMFAREGKMVRAHRVAFELFHGPIPPGAIITHDCDNRLCVSPDHIRAGDWDSNMKEKARRKRSAPQHGEHNPMAKLTHDKVVAIRKLLSDGVKQDHIAAAFKISQSAVSDIKRGNRWAHG